MTTQIVRKDPALLFLLAGWIAVAPPMLSGQAQQTDSKSVNTIIGKPAFEVISIKSYKSMSGSWQLTTTPEGFNATNVTLLDLMREANGFNDSMANDRILGVPAWVNAKSYDVVVKVANSYLAEWQNPSQKDLMLMLQSILADRFKLKMHRETKEGLVYALFIAKSGPKLKEAKPKDPSGRGVSMVRSSNEIFAQGISLRDLAKLLTPLMDRPVEDKTGLTGTYDFTLQWKSDRRLDQMPSGPGTGSLRVSPTLPPDSSGPSIFKAIEDQLGLNLKSAKGPEDYLVIDHVEMPAEK